MSPAAQRPDRTPGPHGARVRSLLPPALHRYAPLRRRPARLPLSPRALLPLRRPLLVYGPADRLKARRIARRLELDGTHTLRPGPPGLTDVLVLSLDAPGRDRLAVKHARTGPAVTSLDHEWRVLEALAADERLGSWRALVPAPVRRALTGPLPLITETWLPGTTADRLLPTGPGPDRTVAEHALTTIAGLHRATGRTETATGRLVAWVDEPLDALRAGIPWCRTGTGAVGLARVRARLRAGLAGAETTVAWTHGDFHAGNVLLDEPTGRVTGVIDWGGARPDGPCAIDAYTFVIALTCRRERRQLGSTVREMVRRGALPGPDLALLDRTRADLVDLRRDGPAGPPDGAVLPLLTWLWHIVSNVTKAPRYARSHWWVTRNVTPLLEEAATWPATRS
ncbi:aminoglycoside phosphotransferase family protein [Kitasatospora sp. NPDC048545]|uniref:phosphotransferase family protein n=1 Tax=Kitasatospora sp. NPDC048545 TaxID=3157208 RepID=UPI00340A736E